MLQKELPNVSAQLLDILTLERRHQFLPNDVAAIVLRLIDVRNAIFLMQQRGSQETTGS